MLNFFQRIKKSVAISLVTLLLVTSTLTILPAPANADNISVVKDSLLSIRWWKDLKETAKSLVPPNPFVEVKNIIEDGLKDGIEGHDNSNQKATSVGLATTALVVTSVGSAASAGAGALAGYAGIASAVSSMGLGGVTTAIAGAMGSNVFGAAATAVVTSAVGGPVVMSMILAGGTAATAYGTYEAAHWIGKQFQLWK
jgi:hypothetical protein